jgi:adenylate kinase
MIALTGTPGCGKTEVAKILRKRGYRVVSVLELAEVYECVVERGDDEIVVDVEKLAEKVHRTEFEGIVEGHLSHLLKPEVAIVLRCNPLILKNRLMEKGWSKEKVMENVEAELLDVILIEALESCEMVYEIDTSEKTPEEVADDVERILSGDVDNFIPKTDWLSLLEDRLEEVARF